MERIISTPEDMETVIFRPSKKRKIYRHRPIEDNSNLVPPQLDSAEIPAPVLALAPADVTSPEPDESEDADTLMSDILRLRKLRKHRVGGVEFRASSMAERTEDGQDEALVLHDRKPDDLHEVLEPESGAVRRFAKQTGMVGDVDKHMMAYIDSELAKRRLNAISSSIVHQKVTADLSENQINLVEQVSSTKPLERQPATLGKLQEIDLGNEARDRNVIRTEQARRRLDGEEIEDDSTPGGKPKKVRLGRDGKPWRERKRRTSDDVRRDKLVEEVLRENRIELYEEPPRPFTSQDGSGDGEADDRIAEAFRREFMDAVSQRQRKKPASAAPTRGVGGKKDEEILKGPKLGGSRSARAAMREAQLKELRAGKK